MHIPSEAAHTDIRVIEFIFNVGTSFFLGMVRSS